MHRWSKVIIDSLAAGAFLGCTAISAAQPCDTPGTWYSPEQGKQLDTAEVMARLGDASFVLLGERHDSYEHHRWQLHVLSALLGTDNLAAVGFEMFPRSSQPILDDWVKGALTVDSFLSKSNWDKVWSFNPDLYMPLFHFVRMHQIPSQALNVDRATVRQIREQGLAEMSSDDLEGVSKPAKPHASYRKHLAEVLEQHPGDINLKRFIAAQTFWDRAMAEGLTKAHEAHGSPVVGIVGMGHAQYGHGLPLQLRDLGQEDVIVLSPHEIGETCPPDDRADYLFMVSPQPADKPSPPRMGVGLELDEEQRVRITKVFPDSPAAAAGIKAGDRIIKAAGDKLGHARDLQTAVQQQPPGTWLPLLIERNGDQEKIVVKFPPQG